MDSTRVQKFSILAGQELPESFDPRSEKYRELGAQLLLSEVLEYIIKGLGVTPEVNGTPIANPDDLKYTARKDAVNQLEMLDGLADVAYTMFWNACNFGLKLEHAFDAVCDNNLSKFVKLDDWNSESGVLDTSDWHLNLGVTWPEEVVHVEVVEVSGDFFAVGKDKSGKVRKPSTYQSVDLSHLLD